MYNTNTSITDPLEYFPCEILEQIFSYLPVKDLIRASCVSSLWYDFIGSSSNLMRNVKLKITCNMDSDYSTNIMEAIARSTRHYEVVEIERCAQCMETIFELMKGKQWKDVTITNTCFSDPEQALLFFSLIEKDVKSLFLSGVYVRYPFSDGKNKGLTFPNLKSFVSRNTQSFLLPEIFQNIQNLKHFDLFSNDQNIASLNAVMNFLKRNDQLESLSISGRVFYQVLFEDISLVVPFKLKKLFVANGSFQSGSFYKRVYKNFVNFINQQAKHLEIVSLDDWMGEDVLKSIFQLPKLKNLTIKGFTHIYNINWDILNGMSINKSVDTISLTMIPDDLSLLKAIIVSAPNLTTLSISIMNFQFLDFISRHALSLKNLTIKYFNVSFIPRRDLFKNLEQLDVKDYSLCLRESIMRKSFQVLSDFERMLFFIMID